MHALSDEQWELNLHSGRQFGGRPMWLGEHLQVYLSSLIWHSAFLPHGRDKHGFILLIWWQTTSASPVYPGAQLQIGLCSSTVQMLFTPQRPTQGSTQFWFIHCLLLGQSKVSAHFGVCFTTGRHGMTALPIIPRGQLHHGTWLYTVQMAFDAQEPMHGSVHLFLKQALSLGQSWFRAHSGLHDVFGSPWNPDRHEQVPSMQWAFFPHVDGLHSPWKKKSLLF